MPILTIFAPQKLENKQPHASVFGRVEGGEERYFKWGDLATKLGGGVGGVIGTYVNTIGQQVYWT